MTTVDVVAHGVLWCLWWSTPLVGLMLGSWEVLGYRMLGVNFRAEHPKGEIVNNNRGCYNEDHKDLRYRLAVFYLQTVEVLPLLYNLLVR